ncbi:MAG: hypothetical protein GEV11_14620 [Streptosporangiales bacterium]|nr:hypothetical protein [Streptosporangiales bacterium]
MNVMTCPKCGGGMRQFERSNIVVDQCTECRGIFLDRGELERLVDAEAAWHGGGGARPAQHAPPPPQQHGRPYPSRDPYRGSDPYYGSDPYWGSDRRRPGMHGGHGGHGGHYKKRRKSFLEGLFDD